MAFFSQKRKLAHGEYEAVEGATKTAGGLGLGAVEANWDFEASVVREDALDTASEAALHDAQSAAAQPAAESVGTLLDELLEKFPLPDTPSGRGPRDSDGHEAPAAYLDLGALYVPRIPGMQIRAEVNRRDKRTINRILLIVGAGGIGVSVVAAPKSGGAWDDMREQISSSVVSTGGSAEEVDGPYGVELHGQVPVKLPDSSKALTPIKVIGVEGLRWVIRLDLLGKALTDERARKACEKVIDLLIVNRGTEARVRFEPLPLKLPPGAGNGAEAREVKADTVGADAGGDL